MGTQNMDVRSSETNHLHAGSPHVTVTHTDETQLGETTNAQLKSILLPNEQINLGDHGFNATASNDSVNLLHDSGTVLL